MERIHASIGRLFVFSVFLSVILFLLLQNAILISSSHHKAVLALKIPTPTTIPTPTNAPTPQVTHPTSVVVVTAVPSDDGVWERLAQCESGGHWGDDTGNGYFGGLQFSQGAWESVGGVGRPSNASKEEQISRGKMLQAARGWAPWGTCSKSLGL